MKDELQPPTAQRSRWYDAALGRFVSADSLVPGAGNPQALNRYAYVINNPMLLVDPSGHMPIQGCGDEGKSACYASALDRAINAQILAVLEYDPTGRKQQRNREIAETILYGGTELVASLLFEPADWAFTGYHCLNGDCSPLILIGLFPLIPGSLGRRVDDVVDTTRAVNNIIDARQEYGTFRQLKKALGNAGEEMNWHHIVEQSQIKKSGFTPQGIHRIDNILAVERMTHYEISGYYSSIRPFTDGLRVRDWLAGQRFEAQF